VKVIELLSDDVEQLVLNQLPTAPRTVSPAHVSNIIRDIENAVLKPGQRRPYDELSKSERQRLGTYASVGWAWEDAIRDALVSSGLHPLSSDRYQPVGQLSLDGIYGSPDGFDTVDCCVEEFKATWRSSNRPLDPDFWHWLVQIKAYCKMLTVNWARLRVFYVNGNYRESGPQIKQFRLEWSQLEIDDNWKMLRGHAKAKGWIR